MYICQLYLQYYYYLCQVTKIYLFNKSFYNKQHWEAYDRSILRQFVILGHTNKLTWRPLIYKPEQLSSLSSFLPLNTANMSEKAKLELILLRIESQFLQWWMSVLSPVQPSVFPGFFWDKCGKGWRTCMVQCTVCTFVTHLKIHSLFCSVKITWQNFLTKFAANDTKASFELDRQGTPCDWLE